MSAPWTERCRVGCAGWSLSRHDAPAFPAEGSHLERYAAVFTAAEINSSFYREHKAQTYARWAASTPDGFRFSVKMPRTVTHDKRLAGADEELARFAEQAGALQDKLEWVLVQLPPKLEFDATLAAQFIESAQAHLPCAIALEARHVSWFGDEATALLAQRGVTRVTADPPAKGVSVHVPTTDAYYVRLHGSPRIYYSSYPDAYLAQLAEAMQAHARTVGRAWCIFDNTAGQVAVGNGLEMMRRLGTAAR
ncbi:DUF72 domain-containing protein [Pseudoduganella sp. GCM10020061]|uniref:DUF72 domain-containing protein n=1 Tax=Pseudoduganella sp. GCM10020061 TaxID=3317345 RepID=UPI003627F380